MKYGITFVLVVGIALFGIGNILADPPNSPPSDKPPEPVSDPNVPPPGHCHQRGNGKVLR
jgi:hypothetical protein